MGKGCTSGTEENAPYQQDTALVTNKQTYSWPTCIFSCPDRCKLARCCFTMVRTVLGSFGGTVVTLESTSYRTGITTLSGSCRGGSWTFALVKSRKRSILPLILIRPDCPQATSCVAGGTVRQIRQLHFRFSLTTRSGMISYRIMLMMSLIGSRYCKMRTNVVIA